MQCYTYSLQNEPIIIYTFSQRQFASIESHDLKLTKQNNIY
jgi:hypothetical protein